MNPRSWSIRRRLVVAFVGVLIPYVALAAIGVVGLRAVLGSVATIFHDATVEQRAISDLELALAALEQSAERLTSSWSPVGRADLEREAARFRDALATLGATKFHDRDDPVLIAAAIAEAAAVEGLAREILAGSVAHADPGGAAKAERLRAQVDTVGVRLNRLQAHIVREMAGDRKHISAVTDRMVAGALAAVAVSVAGGVALAFLFSVWITRPIHALARASGAVAGGDLSQRVETRVGGELGAACVAFNEMAARVQALQQSLADRVQELETALGQVKQLKGLLPICSYCKKVRRDQSYWQQIDAYVAEHSDAQFSHGVCPDCYRSVVKPQLDAFRSEARAEAERQGRSGHGKESTE